MQQLRATGYTIDFLNFSEEADPLCHHHVNSSLNYSLDQIRYFPGDVVDLQAILKAINELSFLVLEFLEMIGLLCYYFCEFSLWHFDFKLLNRTYYLHLMKTK